MKNTSTVKGKKLEEELDEFKNWLSRQINKTIYAKYHIKQPLKQTYQKELLEKIKTILKNEIKKPVRELTKDDIDQWIERSYSKYKINSHICRTQAMNYFVTYLGHSDWKVKTQAIEKKHFPTLTEQEREKYIDAANKRCESILNKDISQLSPKEMKMIMEKSIILLQTLTISRPMEVCQIQIKNLDFQRHKITLEDSKTHDMLIRSGLEDILLTTHLVEESIEDWLRIRKTIRAKKPEDEKYLFIHPEGRYRGQVIEYNKVLRLCKRIGVEAGITSVRTTPYCLKRTEITRDCDRNVNIKIPMTRARHLDFVSTQRYNNKSVNDVLSYLNSQNYESKNISLETQIQRLAEKAIRGEIPIDLWEKLRADLLKEHSEPKKKQDIVGYG